MRRKVGIPLSSREGDEIGETYDRGRPPCLLIVETALSVPDILSSSILGPTGRRLATDVFISIGFGNAFLMGDGAGGGLGDDGTEVEAVRPTSTLLIDT